MPSALCTKYIILAAFSGLFVFTLRLSRSAASQWLSIPLRQNPAFQPHYNPAPFGFRNAATYVISLPRRVDRRASMEQLCFALGLDCTYINATDAKDSTIDDIISSVSDIRSKAMAGLDASIDFKISLPFAWPADLEERARSPAPLAMNSIPRSLTPGTLSISCATEDFTIEPFRQDLPPQRRLTPGRVACWHSHLSLLLKIANEVEDAKVSVVLEDDVDLEENIEEQLVGLWGALPNEWDILFLGHCWSDETHHLPIAQISTLKTSLHPSHSPKCTHAYIISHLGARRLALHLTHPPFAYSRALDQAIAWLIESGRLRAFSVVPSVAIQRKVQGGSDIAEDSLAVWSDELVSSVLGGLSNS
ncbi:hypothetical protein DL96DRAFT_116366 [Flagelloscypha sp. PMI_526]|nr:hypothetical protein DL96DRAFT_116366 [Flagelloscypha sp. PMI_526]